MTNDVHKVSEAARHWFGKQLEQIDDAERRVLRKALSRQTLSQNTDEIYDESLTFGERLADHVAEFGGSWTFIIIFALALAAWTLSNIYLLLRPFDPYPFIFLNLLLSMLAAIQAPIIMMSQNRQAVKDRLAAAHDYEVNLKAEIEIMALHEKLDQLRTDQITTILQKQQEQIELLTQLVKKRTRRAS